MSTHYVLDTNVLIPFLTKDFFMELGKRGLPVHWSLGIEKEFRRVWTRLYPDSSADSPKILSLMRQAVPDWRASEARNVLKSATLPDADDVHVLAAAVGVGAKVIVTRNLKDYPATALAPYGVTALGPDEVLCAVFDEDPVAFLAAAKTMRARLKNPAMTAQQWLQGVEAGDLKQLAAKLRPHAASL